MSTLYIRPPPRSAADSASSWLALDCPFALASRGGVVEREGVASFAQLSGVSGQAQRVVVLLAASDVTLLRVRVPPLSAARMKAALPNLVEEHLIDDPSNCLVVAGGLSGGLRSVAVMQRDWLDFLANTLIASGARRIVALPAQLCLPCQPAQEGQPRGVAAAIGETGYGTGMTLRFNEQEGVGLALAPVQGQGGESESREASAREAIRTLCALAPDDAITLYVPPAALRVYQDEARRVDAPGKRINVLADNWPRWIAGAQGVAPDLMAGSGMAAGSEPDWRAWRWPVALAAAVLLANAIALNADWWRMKREAGSLRASMIQIYKSAYPNETVILDPVAQMRQRIDTARHDAGQPSPDDFTAILAAFGDAWNSAMPGKAASVIDALEYRERSLHVRFKHDSEAPLQQIQTALAERNLSLDTVSAQPLVWKIRSAQ